MQIDNVVALQAGHRDSLLGHYRVTHRCALVATQAANSRLFEIRNTHATRLIIPTGLTIRWVQTAAHTAAIEDSLDVVRVTGFSAVDTVNTVTLTGSRMRTLGMAAAPGGALLRGVTGAGAAAGMTGGTLVEDAEPLAQLPQWLLLGQPTAGQVAAALADSFSVGPNHHPPALVLNEGLIIKNRVLLGAAAGSSVYIDFSWAEVEAF